VYAEPECQQACKRFGKGDPSQKARLLAERCAHAYCDKLGDSTSFTAVRGRTRQTDTASPELPGQMATALVTHSAHTFLLLSAEPASGMVGRP